MFNAIFLRAFGGAGVVDSYYYTIFYCQLYGADHGREERGKEAVLLLMHALLLFNGKDMAS